MPQQQPQQSLATTFVALPSSSSAHQPVAAAQLAQPQPQRVAAAVVVAATEKAWDPHKEFGLAKDEQALKSPPSNVWPGPRKIAENFPIFLRKKSARKKTGKIYEQMIS